MPKKINAASRLQAILQTGLTYPENAQTLEVWATLFSISESSPNRKSLAVAEQLKCMHRELVCAMDQMREGQYREDLYSGAFAQIEESFSAMYLPGTWNQVKQYLPPQTMTALDFCSELLPDEESAISEEDLGDIKKRVDELREFLDQANLPKRLKILIAHHIGLINRALAEYPILGAKALREAAREGLGELIEVRDTVQANHDAPEIDKLGQVWKKVNEAADAALKMDKLAQVGQKAWALLENIF